MGKYATGIGCGVAALGFAATLGTCSHLAYETGFSKPGSTIYKIGERIDPVVEMFQEDESYKGPVDVVIFNGHNYPANKAHELQERCGKTWEYWSEVISDLNDGTKILHVGDTYLAPAGCE